MGMEAGESRGWHNDTKGASGAKGATNCQSFEYTSCLRSRKGVDAMRVVTISREFGSGGDLLAEQVAAALGYHLVDKAFISAVLNQYGLVEFDSEYEKRPGIWERLSVDHAERRDVMARMLDRVVRSVARHGDVVILGRSSYAILADLADVLHIRLQAPLHERAKRIAAQQNLNPDAATTLVLENDRVRTAFVESFYRVPWSAASAFDLAINSAVVPIDTATSWVVELARSVESKPGAARTSLQLEEDQVMQQTIAERLHCQVTHA